MTNAPFMALTATNEEIQAFIEESLNMAEPVVISDWPNVYYSAGNIKSIDVS